jgi:hypothetical protein
MTFKEFLNNGNGIEVNKLVKSRSLFKNLGPKVTKPARPAVLTPLNRPMTIPSVVNI